MTPLLSPRSGRALRPAGPDILTDGDERWPVLDGIPYLRTGRDDLVASVLGALESGDREGALILALADQDAWWDGPVASEADRRRLVRSRDALSLREAMDLLAWGRVGHYFAHRWSDPTYLAGLALLDAHWTAPASAFELACGIGHYLRDLSLRGVDCVGGDVVFAKLWVARHWVCPAGIAQGSGTSPRSGHVDLVCFDAGSPWPVVGPAYDLALCHDAFYFLEPKRPILAVLRGLVREGGTLAIGHIHNREAENLSAGAGVTAAEIAALFPTASVYDDADLTRKAAEGRLPVPRAPAEIGRVEAFSLAEGGIPGRSGASGLLAPPDGVRPRLNPLYRPDGADAAIAWPSGRYRDEYAARATFRPRLEAPLAPTAEGVRRREFLDLPERW